MATLEQIGYTTLMGSVVLSITFVFFGCAVRKQHPFIAPRADARPRNVIYRYPNTNGSSSSRNASNGSSEEEHSTNLHQQQQQQQQQQSKKCTASICCDSTFGWIPWTLSLSYDTMLQGVHGTGTRQDGMTGSLLNVNLDGIVLLRFTTMCLRICCLSSVLFIFLGIPIYLSAQCYIEDETTTTTTYDPFNDISNSTINIPSSPVQTSCDGTSYNLTNYERITIFNVPTIKLQNPISTVVHPQNGILWRLYTIVFCFWIVITYLCHLLHNEYVEILAMRRVYFFEYDIWESRRAELKQTLFYEEIAEQKRQQLIIEQQQQQELAIRQEEEMKERRRRRLNGDDDYDNDDDDMERAEPVNKQPQQHQNPPNHRFTFDDTVKRRIGLNRIQQWKERIALRGLTTGTPTNASSLSLHPDPHLVDREPWIPHPEQRDTVPNIAVYSILVGGLPSLPEQAADSFNSESAIQFSQRESIDWQLSLTTAFFDHCVPNQPGFSSSIAAVTIVPGAMDLSIAWRKWYMAAAKLRRLRFIRKHIQLRRHYDIESQQKLSSKTDINTKDNDALQYEYGDSVDYGYEDSIPAITKTNSNKNTYPHEDDEDIFVPANASSEEIVSYLSKPPPIPKQNWIGRETTPRGVYDDNPQNQLYYRQVLGSALGVESDTHIYDALEFGPEQASVYAREFAQSSAPCCPNGLNEGYIMRAPIDSLLEMERVVAVQVHQANLELREARFRALRTDDRNAGNIHDQQQGRTTKPANTGNGVTNANKTGATTVTNPSSQTIHRRGHTISQSMQPQPTLAEDEDEDSDKIIDMLPKDVIQNHQNQPMASRYDRRASANDETTQQQQQVKPLTTHIVQQRLDPTRIDNIAAAAAGNSKLALEAQLFKKVSTATVPINRSASLHHQQTCNIIDVSESSHNDTSNNSNKNYSKNPKISNGATTIRRRNNVQSSDHSSSVHWTQVETLITEARKHEPSKKWHCPSLQWLLHYTKLSSKSFGTWAKKQSKVAVNSLARESSYAVVTFTSRQAAVAARACLADGRGSRRWMTLKEIPIPPLADAAPFDFINVRNCCRPVTLSINERQKNFRNYVSLIFLGFLFVFYTVPLTLASQLVDPESVARIFPEAAGKARQYSTLVSGLVTASIWSTFFALCPVIFRSVANFGSKSTSVASAEFKALQYFWWFMMTTAFSGQLLATMGLKAFNEGLSIESELQTILRSIAGSIPTTVAVSWLNWIIFRCTITLPLNYMLQINTFLLDFFGMKCCSRLIRGGGPGASVPYRIYIDSGVVLMCTLTLAPASPIVALASVCYFLFLQPILRRNLIFMYRPRFDGGGFRWPFIFDMCISATYLAILLLTVQMALKQAAGPAAAAALTAFPLYFFQTATKYRFLRAFEDAGLLQTSLLDGWDTAAEYSMEKREEFRRFLVDAHKAAYVPICLAGSDTDSFLTAEPAIVVDEDIDQELVQASVRDAEQSSSTLNHPIPQHPSYRSSDNISFFATDQPPKQNDGDEIYVYPPSPPKITSNTLNISTRNLLPPTAHDHGAKPHNQHGVTVRRAVNKCRRMSMINYNKSIDEHSATSPFDRSAHMMEGSYHSSNPPFSPSPRSRSDSSDLIKNESGHFS